MDTEKIQTPTHHESLNSRVSKEEYVKQETTRSCGIATTLMARNILSGDAYPYSVKEAIELMKTRGYSESASGRTRTRDRRILVDQLNENQETKLIHNVVEMPVNEDEYFNQLEEILESGAVVMVGFKEPYFNIPESMEVEARGRAHGALVHGIKRGANGERLFIVTDPEIKIAEYFGRNIDVTEDKLIHSLSNQSKKRIEVVSTST